MQQHATNIVRELRNRGFQAYFAGGCVRDTLLGVVPADYDVATDATPPEVMRIFPETYAVGAQFGVVLVPLRLPDEAHPDPKQEKLGLDRSRCSVRAPQLRRGRHLPQRWHLHRRPPSRPRQLLQGSQGRRAAPRLHHQRPADGPAGRQPRARFRRRARRPEGRRHSRHRRSRAPLRRRQAAHAARGALRRALRTTPSSRKPSPPSSGWRREFSR